MSIEGEGFHSNEAMERIRNEWRCEQGHVWRKDWSETCPYCAKAADAIEIERLQALFEGRWKDAAEAYLKSAGPGRDGTFEFNIKVGIVPLIAAHLAATFKAMGGKNYIQIEVNHDELGPLVLTMQRRLGKLPAVVAAEEKARADAAEAKLEALAAARTPNGGASA